MLKIELSAIKDLNTKLETTLKTSEELLRKQVRELSSKLEASERKITLETSEKDLYKTKYNEEMMKRAAREFPAVAQVKLHSERVENMENYTRNEWRIWIITLEAS